MPTGTTTFLCPRGQTLLLVSRHQCPQLGGQMTLRLLTSEGNGKPLQHSCLENPMNSMSCISYLYILEINPLSVISFANIYFFPYYRLSFCFVVVSFTVKNPLSLLKSHLVILLLLPLPQETSEKKYCYNLCQRVFCLCFL